MNSCIDMVIWTCATFWATLYFRSIFKKNSNIYAEGEEFDITIISNFSFLKPMIKYYWWSKKFCDTLLVSSWQYLPYRVVQEKVEHDVHFALNICLVMVLSAKIPKACFTLLTELISRFFQHFHALFLCTPSVCNLRCRH